MSNDLPNPYNPTDALPGQPRSAVAFISPPGADLKIEFDAFIPGSLGKSFESYPHPTDLKNQAAFDAAIKAIAGTWLPEPGTFDTGGAGSWYYLTDNRGFGGGGHRVGFVGTVARGDVGALASKSNVFTHSTSGSAHVRWTHTGYFTSKDETGKVDGPYTKSGAVTSDEKHTDISSDESTITTTGACGYPFKAASPDIDYKLVFDVKKDHGGATLVQAEVTNNLFPYYELLINGKVVWKFVSTDTGPGVINLNRSTTEKTGWLSF